MTAVILYNFLWIWDLSTCENLALLSTLRNSCSVNSMCVCVGGSSYAMISLHWIFPHIICSWQSGNNETAMKLFYVKNKTDQSTRLASANPK